MTEEAKWEQEISNMTMKIHQEFPELSKYINEIPAKVLEKERVITNGKNLKEFYYSLVDMVNTYSNTHEGTNTLKTKFPGYPHYRPSEDIYQKSKEEENIDPDDLSNKKAANQEEISWNEKDFKDDISGDDLDIPGSELDDQQESVGSEDEENNYYSLGGDDHNDLDVDKG